MIETKTGNGMNVRFEVNGVLPKLIDVSSVIGSRNSIEILSDVCVTVNKENVILTASDGENWVTERAEVLSSDTELVFCTPAKDLLNCMKTLSDETVTMTVDDKCSIMTLDYVDGMINLPCEPADGFPKPDVIMDDASEFLFNGNMLRSIVRTAGSSTENSVIRPILSGVHFGFGDGSMVVNGASHIRMVKIVEAVSTEKVLDGCGFTIPPKAVSVISSVLEKVDEDVKVRFTDKAVSVSNRNFRITSRLLEGKYPDCDLAIQKNCTVRMEVSRERMVQALRHVLSINNERSLVELVLSEDNVSISAENENFGRTSEEAVPCKRHTDDGIDVCLNGDVLSDTLRSITAENVVFEMSEPMKPVMVYASGEDGKDRYLNILMPMVKPVPVEARQNG